MPGWEALKNNNLLGLVEQVSYIETFENYTPLFIIQVHLPYQNDILYMTYHINFNACHLAVNWNIFDVIYTWTG